MYNPNSYVIYEATPRDAGKLWYLEQLTGLPRLRGRVLIGEIQGSLAAGFSLTEDRMVADHRRDTSRLTPLLRSRAQSLRALERTPSQSDRIRAGVRINRSWPSAAEHQDHPNPQGDLGAPRSNARDSSVSREAAHRAPDSLLAFLEGL